MTYRNCKISKNQTHNRCYSDYMMYMLMHTCLLLFVRSRHFLIIFKSRNYILQYEISVWIYLYLSLSSLTFKGFSHSFISIISPVLFWAFSWRFELPCFQTFNPLLKKIEGSIKIIGKIATENVEENAQKRGEIINIF